MRPDLPSGTVTFLFTDVEGSTKLLHELGAERYAEALAKHRRVIRAACDAEGGVEVDTQGDACFFAFATAPGALAAAEALTAALAQGSIQVRIGLHTGTPLLAEDGYVGGDVHRAARIAAVGHGGQVLVSSTTAPLVEVELTDLGEHRLKDLSAPERIYQLGEDAFPTLNSLYRTNLPIPSTPFLGREAELAEVASLLASSNTRLLTLTGPGGTGKTRLAVQAAGFVSDRYSDGVWWIPLAPVRDPTLVLVTAAQVVGSKNGLADHIQDKEMLCLFDNFEQVVEAAADVAELLASCPNLDLLVTSREPLHVTGEQEYAVPPFVHEDGVGFFLARARAVKADFEAGEAVSEICRRLDDLPLALELAAARVKALTSTQILERLEHRLPLLTGGAHDLPERQRTLRATIEWSYDLLGEEERRLFSRLSVFSGGCTLEAAEEVAGANVDTLQSLVDKSLVRFTNGRYWMLETIREFATNRLRESDEKERLHTSHADHYLALARRAEPELEGPEQGAWMEQLDLEHDNLRAALDWCAEVDRNEDALRGALALRRFWDARTAVDEMQRRFEALLSVEQPLDLRANALRDLYAVAYSRGDYDRARSLADERLSLYRTLGDEFGVQHTLQGLALIAAAQGDLDEARALITPVVSWARGVSDWELTYPLETLAEIAMRGGHYDEAHGLYNENLSIYERLGDVGGIANSCLSIGEVLLHKGSKAEALPYLRRGLRLTRDLGLFGGVAWALELVAFAALLNGDATAAARLLGRRDAVFEEIGLAPTLSLGPREQVVIASTAILGGDGFAAAHAEGEGLSLDDAVALALEVVDA